jgi:hypothetical protein
LRRKCFVETADPAHFIDLASNSHSHSTFEPWTDDSRVLLSVFKKRVIVYYSVIGVTFALISKKGLAGFAVCYQTLGTLTIGDVYGSKSHGRHLLGTFI